MGKWYLGGKARDVFEFLKWTTRGGTRGGAKGTELLGGLKEEGVTPLDKKKKVNILSLHRVPQRGDRSQEPRGDLGV